MSTLPAGPFPAAALEEARARAAEEGLPVGSVVVL
jgi:hypothetical protein